MKIGLIAPPWLSVPPLGYGGTEMVIDLLARGLHARGHDVVLFATGDSRCPVPTMWEFPAALSTRSADDHAAHVRHLDAAYRHLTQADVEVIHDHTVLGPTLHDPGVPVVATMHGVMDEATRQLCGQFPPDVAVVAISASQRDSAPEVEFRAIIHHGIDVARVPFGTGSGGYLLFLGRMSRTKGARTAIDIARAARIPLTMAAKVSDEGEQRYFSQEIEPLLGGDVTFVGEADAGHKQALIGGAMGLLNPIKWREPFGLVMIESLAAGTPVIAAPQGAATEIIEQGRTGFLCPTLADAIDACHAIGTLSRDDCRAVAQERFSADGMVAHHESLYLDLVHQQITIAPAVAAAGRERRSAARGLFARRDACPDCGRPFDFAITRGHVTLHCDQCHRNWRKDLGAIYRLDDATATAGHPAPPEPWGLVRRPVVQRSPAETVARQ